MQQGSAGLLVRPGTGRVLGVGVWALAALAAALVLRALQIGRIDAVETFVLIATSIIIEALPFVLLGALVSGLIEVFVSDRVFTRLAGLPVAVQLPGAALGGLAFPVCECGSVPVARRLIARGMHPAAGLAFMLAAPVLNPIVLASTWVAYRGRGLGVEMVTGRAALGLLLAIAAGWALAGPRKDLLKPVARDEHAHEPATGSRTLRVVDHMTSDFFFMARYLVVGAALAALLQTAVPQDIVAGIARTPVLGSLGLMAIAFALSLCSEADAFVAVSFVQFPLGAQLAFLVFGPVVDAKLAFLYGATFRRQFVARLMIVAIPVVLAGSLWFEVILR